MRLISFIMNKIAGAGLTARLPLKSKTLHGSVKEDMLTSFVKALNHLLEIYATSNIIAQADAEIVRFTQPTNMSTLQYANFLFPLEQGIALAISV